MQTIFKLVIIIWIVAALFLIIGWWWINRRYKREKENITYFSRLPKQDTIIELTRKMFAKHNESKSERFNRAFAKAVGRYLDDMYKLEVGVYSSIQ